MPEFPRAAASPPRGSSGPVRVRIAGIAAASATDGRGPELRALRDADIEPLGLTAVISVGAALGSAESAAGVCVRLGLGGVPHVHALDVIDDGCGVPSSIAVGASILMQRSGAVLLSVGGAALVMVGVPGRVVAVDAVTVVTGRRTADVSLKRAGPLTAVDQVLASVGGDVPIVAAVSGGIRPPADRRVVGVVPTSGGSAPIEGLCRARAAGYTEVALVTADEHGHAAVVVCDLGRRPDSQRQ
ncbi:hypothetical protein [Gordonia sp. (in: high G+C Gram-positive bacteria)]|uniref:hypothetical protein n=1 Tax=Gordonia sp. (in: high G+C Gram-positive bacteria) TaxID=84139 RepID=UPI001691DF5F|nr:hypothetical protein [Gordonia sp. (in: high G+C Gram-positive bacteria)]NLG46065.1 hypothetical protein [Gordonia sp. (in: high G+C Gram-positive bacteria)]